jgi:hypothetical protein
VKVRLAAPAVPYSPEEGQPRRAQRQTVCALARRLLGAAAIAVAAVNVRLAAGANYGDLAGPGFRGLAAELLIGYALVFWLRAAPVAAARVERALRLCYRACRRGSTSWASPAGPGNPS